jgi:hypothetical protein
MTDENGWPVVKAGRCDKNALRVLRLSILLPRITGGIDLTPPGAMPLRKFLSKMP